jgi:hypothetical protein
MLTIIGKILKKEIKKNSKKAEIVLQDEFNNQHSFQIRPNKLHKLIEVDTGQRVEISYKTHLSERYNDKNNNWTRITYLILDDVKLI